MPTLRAAVLCGGEAGRPNARGLFYYAQLGSFRTSIVFATRLVSANLSPTLTLQTSNLIELRMDSDRVRMKRIRIATPEPCLGNNRGSLGHAFLSRQLFCLFSCLLPAHFLAQGLLELSVLKSSFEELGRREFQTKQRFLDTVSEYERLLQQLSGP